MIRPLKWKVEHDRSVLCDNFERRDGWTCSNSENDWNIYWASTSTVQTLFHPERGKRLNADQVVCHFPNYYELTRKDSMVRNIKRYMRAEIQRQSRLTADNKDANAKSKSNGDHGGGNGSKNNNRPIKSFLPSSYSLPSEYNIFVEEFRRSASSSSNTWIMKPPNGAQGRGIFIVNKLEQLKKWSGSNASNKEHLRYVISRYIDNPLLIGGKKFDLRIYVLITSFRPLKIFLGNGFARLANSDYSNDARERLNRFIHLTNVSIQKKSEDYNSAHGGKWDISNLRLYLEATRGNEATAKMFEDIEDVIVYSAKAVQNVMNNDRHCFECYGYDLLIDDDLKPWLIEINASPSLSATTPSDKRMKMDLIKDVVDIVVSEKFGDESDVLGSGSGVPDDERTQTMRDTGDFVLLYDEAAGRRRGGVDDDKKKSRYGGRRD